MFFVKTFLAQFEYAIYNCLGILNLGAFNDFTGC